MEQDLALQLQEKNLEILKNKLKLDVSNNMNSLTLSLNHILDFEVTSALSKFLTIYQDVSCPVEEDELHQILIQIGQKYLEEMKQNLRKKKSDIFEEIDNFSIPFQVDDFTHFLNTIDEDDFFVPMKDILISYIENSITNELRRLNQKSVTQENQDFVFSREMAFLTDHFVRRLVDKTEEQVQVRNQTFVNNAKSNYEHYCTLPSGL